MSIFPVKKELKLVVTDGGDDNGNDHADWADAQFTATTGPDIELLLNGKPFDEEKALPDSESVAFTWELKDTGNGTGEASATFDGKAYKSGG
ncbi:NPCBM/NEW2 domain-containing protein [Virgibacillus halophilus]|uniref:NPCBM/NEW2 domain-containing protein n=1 Tax=Tigheibacillus halophilus TaxID=361280 RepID=A0ABU5C4A2_9BACI|nr:NPCBM/NEW2 domain-containing protein [Virgibacillus halophilus]